MSGATPRARHRAGDTTAGADDRPTRQELLAGRSRGSILLHAGRRRLFPAGATGAARRAQHRVHPGLGHPATVDLAPGVRGDRTRRRGSMSCSTFVARRRPDLRCYILIWDYARALHARARSVVAMAARLADAATRAIRLRRSPSRSAASHHQKVVVVDDQLAFCGGIDLTGHRWDTSAHGSRSRRRIRRSASAYGPYHEVQAMVEGPAAASLGVLARDRWRALGGERHAAGRRVHSTISGPPTSRPTSPTSTSRSRGPMPGIRDAAGRSASARRCFSTRSPRRRRSIYIESQYFTNDRLGDALAARLREPDGPEVIVVAPKECEGWLEQNTMGAFRDACSGG